MTEKITKKNVEYQFEMFCTLSGLGKEQSMGDGKLRLEYNRHYGWVVECKVGETPFGSYRLSTREMWLALKFANELLRLQMLKRGK